MKIDFKEKHSIHSKKPKRTKLEDLERYIDKCKYCHEQVFSSQSFVAFASKQYAHYQCMKEDDEKNTPKKRKD